MFYILSIANAIRDTIDRIKKKRKHRAAELRAERHQLLERLMEINAEIGPMTPAERQRRSRARRKQTD